MRGRHGCGCWVGDPLLGKGVTVYSVIVTESKYMSASYHWCVFPTAGCYNYTDPGESGQADCGPIVRGDGRSHA